MRTFLTFLLVCFSAVGADRVAVASDEPLAAAERVLERGESGFDAESLERAQAIFNRLARAEDLSQSVPYYQARVSLALANIHAWGGKTDRALHSLDQAIASAKQAVRQDPRHSDSHRLLGEAYGRLISLKGGLTGLLYGRRSYNELALALKLGPENPRAALAMGIWKLRTPKLFGGDWDEAVRYFQKAIQLWPANVRSHVWLGIALMERAYWERAREALERALVLQPENAWAERQLAKVRARAQGEE
ncbi:MAG: tetratricopeptide repeat protein [Candidatus Methylomirabilia bacterium]